MTAIEEQPALLMNVSLEEVTTIAQGQCSVQATKPSSTQLNLKPVYKVGVLGNRGLDTLYKEFNLTFADYLTRTAGQQFDPPIRFEIYPLLFGEHGILDKAVSSEHVDFTFMNPALYSCVESEVQANSLATFINHRVVHGKVFEMSQFGGVIFVSKNNTSVQNVKDIAGKRVATTSVTSLGSGQMQFRELQQAGLHHFQSLEQLIFMESQSRVVEAVILGQVDVGFVRTDQLERTEDPRTGQPLDLQQVRIVNHQKEVLLEGSNEPFPVALSTPLYPEWPFSSLSHVPHQVTRQVQTSLLQMKHHAAVAKPLTQCYQERNCTEDARCEMGCYLGLDASLQEAIGSGCSVTTSPSTATLAAAAMTKAKCAGWIPSKSYAAIRNMQEETGFIQTTLTHDKVRCTRTTEIVDAVVCPPGHFRRSRDEVLSGCQTAGLDCYGFQCLCSPCVKAFDVDFFPVDETMNSIPTMEETQGTGCSKFSVCGEARQGGKITFRMVDNQKRVNASFSANVLITEEAEIYNLTQTPGTNHEDIISREFTFDATGQPLGTIIVQVNIDDEQIPESPFRFRIVPPTCEEPLEPSALGECVCPSSTVVMMGDCLHLWVVLPVFFALGLLVVSLVAWLFIRQKHKKMDAIWKVDKSEIIFDDPPRELGQGTFGVVLLAEYRGTAVAVKQMLPDSAVRAAWKGREKKGKGEGQTDLDMMENGRFQNKDRSLRHSDMIGMRSVVVTGTSGMSIGSQSLTRRSSFSSSLLGGGTSLSKLKREFIQEMRTLSRLRHPCIVAVMGAVMEKNEPPTLLMEYMQLGSLYDLLHNECVVLGGETLLPMIQDIAQGLRFLHAAKPKIIHGDIKSQNILVDARFHAKVADFGLATIKPGQAAGTPFWMAPELLRQEIGNTAKSDVYAFGITLSEILSRKGPFHGELHLNVIEELKDPSIDKIPELPKECPPEAEELMLACLRADPSERPSAEDIDVRVKMFNPSKFDSGLGNKPSQANSDLLSQRFPKHVADALREGRTVEPENHECVTVYFSDICGYTEISSTLSTAKVSDLLHRLYTEFDHLCERHDLFKVETVGDAYMVATLNDTNTKENHVATIARFAFDAVAAAASTLIDVDDPTRGYVQIRCGFHSGSVVTHVVGHRNPRYSVIGDVVNTASRMESNSTPGRVTTSKYSAELLKEQFPGIKLKSRGNVVVKGKGMMNIFWVEPPDDFVSNMSISQMTWSERMNERKKSENQRKKSRFPHSSN